MKILVIVNSLEAGGAEKSAVKFAKAINKDIASKVDFATFRNSKNDLYQLPDDIHHYKNLSSYAKADKIPVRIFRVLLKPLMAIKDLYKIRILILNNNYDVVISFGAEAGCMIFLALLLTKTPQITSERIPPNPDVYKQVILAQILRPYIYKKSVLCSVQSIKVKQWVKDNWKIDSYLTPNFFELTKKKYSSFPQNGPVITIGRAVHQKGYDLLLAAWSEYQLLSDRELWIVCDDSNNYVKNLSAKLNIRNLKIIKPQINISALFDECSLYISTSRFEGFPNAITEAIIYGLPVLSTVSSDIVCEFIEQNLCFEIKETSKHGLAEKVNTILSNEQLLISLSKNAINSRNQFDWSSVRDYWKVAIDASIEKTRR